MNSPVQKIKERMPIEDVVSSYIKLEKAGANLRARCPFHNEKTPSFFVSPSRGSYFCFGCSAGGDIFTFVQQFEGLDFRGALKLLADRAGVSLGGVGISTKGEDNKEILYKIMEEATKYFEENLKRDSRVSNYLKNRGLTEESIKVFRIGFAPSGWRSAFTHLVSLGFKEIDIELAGIIKKSDKITSVGRQDFYDRFRSRIMFPIMDSSGRVIAFSGRIFEEDLSSAEFEKTAKYINSPETPIFNKSSVLFGIDKAKDSIRKNNFSILVEGQMDLVLSHQAGFRNTVASSGTALSDGTFSKENAVSNLGLVRRLSNNIVLAFDADKAGLNASTRAGKIALSFGMDVKVANIPDGIDPADLISKEGALAWKEAVRNSNHLIEFLLNRIKREHNGDPRKIGSLVKDKILPFVAILPSAIEQAHFIKIISEKTSIPENALSEDLKKVEIETEKDREETMAIERKETLSKKDYIQRKLLGIVFWQKEVPSPKVDPSRIIKEISEISGLSEEALTKDQISNMLDLVFEAEIFYEGEVDLSKDVVELLRNLRIEHLQEELLRKMNDLKKAEAKKDQVKSAEILKECQVLSEKIQNAKNKN